MKPFLAAEHPGEKADGKDERNRDMPGDVALHQQEHAAEQESDGRCFAQRACPVADEQVLVQGRLGMEYLEEFGHPLFFQQHQRRCRGLGVNGHERRGRRDEGRHDLGETDQNEGPADQSRIEDIVAQPAEEVFGDDNGDKGTDRRDVQRHIGRKVHGQQQAGQKSAAVGQRHRPLQHRLNGRLGSEGVTRQTRMTMMAGMPK